MLEEEDVGAEDELDELDGLEVDVVLVPPDMYAESIQLVELSTVLMLIADVIKVAKLARPLFHAPALQRRS